MARNHTIQPQPLAHLCLACLVVLSGCNWLSQGTGKMSLVRTMASIPQVAISKVQAGAIAMGEGIASELTDSLVTAGLTPGEAEIVVESSRSEIAFAAGTIAIETFSLVETNALVLIAGPAVRGAIKALDEPGVNLGDSERRAAIAQVVMASTVGSLGGRTEGLSTDQVMSLQKDMVGSGVKSLNEAGLGGDQAANAIKALTTGAASSLSRSIDATAAAEAAANIVSGAVESLTSAGISTDQIQAIVGSAVEGVVTQLSKTGVQDAGEAASLIAKSSVQSLKVLALPVEKIIEATEGAAKGAVSALTLAGVPKDAIAAAAQKVASSSASALKTAGVPDESVGKAAGAIASGAIQGLGAAGLTATEISASKSIAAIVSGASSGMTASGVATDRISAALGDVAGTAITAIAKMAKTTTGDLTAIQGQIVSEVIQSTIAQAISVGVASSSNISAVTATIASGAGQGLASLSKSGVQVTNVDSVIQKATVQVLTEQQTKTGMTTSTITAVANSTGQTAQASKTAQETKVSGATFAPCATKYLDSMTDSDFKALVEPMPTLPLCVRDGHASCPKKRLYPAATALWVTIPESTLCQLSFQKLAATALPGTVLSCPAQLGGPISSAPLTEVSTGDRLLYACSIGQGSCPPPPFDATSLSTPSSGAQKCLYTRKFELSQQVAFSLPSGTYGSPKDLWVSAPKEAHVYLTDDGSTPSATNGMLYDGRLLIISSGTTLRAKAVVNGSTVSEGTASYVMTSGQAMPLCQEVYSDTLDNTALKTRIENDYRSTHIFPSCLRRTLDPNCPKARTLDAGTADELTVTWRPLPHSNTCTLEAPGAVAAIPQVACSTALNDEATLTLQAFSRLETSHRDPYQKGCVATPAQNCPELAFEMKERGAYGPWSETIADGRTCHYQALPQCGTILPAPWTADGLMATKHTNEFGDLACSVPLAVSSTTPPCPSLSSGGDQYEISLGRHLAEGLQVCQYTHLEPACPSTILGDTSSSARTPEIGEADLSAMNPPVQAMTFERVCRIGSHVRYPVLSSTLLERGYVASIENVADKGQSRLVIRSQIPWCQPTVNSGPMTSGDVHDALLIASLGVKACEVPVATTQCPSLASSDGTAWITELKSFPKTSSLPARTWCFLKPQTVAPCPSVLTMPVASAGLTTWGDTHEPVYLCQLSNTGTSCPNAGDDAMLLADATSAGGRCIYGSRVDQSPPGIFVPTTSCASVQMLGNTGGMISLSQWPLLETNPQDSSERVCRREGSDACPQVSGDLMSNDVFGPWSYSVGAQNLCAYHEPHRCENIFAGKSSLSGAMLMGSSVSNEFGDVMCTAPSPSACIPLDADASPYVLTTEGALANGRSYCRYTHIEPLCPAGIASYGNGSLVSNPISQTDLSSMSLPEKPFTFERVCLSPYDVRFPVVDATLKDLGYFASSSAVLNGTRIVIHSRAKPCPSDASGSALTIHDVQSIEINDLSAAKSCDVAFLNSCPSLDAEAASFLSASTIHYSPLQKTRCVYTSKNIPLCPNPITFSSALSSMRSVSDYQKNLFLCSIPSGSCPPPESDLTLLSPFHVGPQECVYNAPFFPWYPESGGSMGAVTFSPPPGTYTESQTVALMGPEGATIYFTTDGTAPHAGSSIYSAPIVVDSAATIKAVASKGDLWTEVATGSYIITNNALPPFIPTNFCTFLLPMSGVVGPSPWTALEVSPTNPTQRGCRVAAATPCPLLSNDMLVTGIRGPKSQSSGSDVICTYEEPYRCEDMFNGAPSLTSTFLMTSGYANAFGDVTCTRPSGTGYACPQLEPSSMSHDAITGMSLPYGRTYCHYTHWTPSCPAGIVTPIPGRNIALLSNPITPALFSDMEVVDNSTLSSRVCSPPIAIKYPYVDPTLASQGFLATSERVPGALRLVVRHGAPQCPQLGSGVSLNLSDLRQMTFVENRGVKACDVLSAGTCPTLVGGDAATSYSQQSATYTLNAVSSTRCSYALASPVACPVDPLTTTNLSLIDDDRSPLYSCFQATGVCPPGGSDFNLISVETSGPKQCLYEPQPTWPQSCLALQTQNASTLSSGTYTIDPDGWGPEPAMDVYCDMETDGGGWTLVGRGREGWAWNDAGMNASQVAMGIGTSLAFVPAFLPSATIDKLWGSDGISALNSLQDGVRIKRAADPSGSSYQEMRWQFASLTSWSWLLELQFELSSVTINGQSYPFGYNSRDTWSWALPNSELRTFTWPWDGHQYLAGFSYGETVNNGSNSPTSFLWQYASEGHAIPYTEIYIRH